MAVTSPSSVIYQQTHKHTEIQRKQQVCNHPFNGPKTSPHYKFTAKDTHKTTVLYLGRTDRGTDPYLGSLPGTSAKQLNGSPHDERGRRSDDLFRRPSSRSCVRRTTRTPADAPSIRLDNDDDHVASTPLQADVPVPRSSRGPSCSRQPRSGRLFCRS